MQNVRVDSSGIGELLLGPDMRSLMLERAEIAQAIYREQVSKRTGTLARSARVETFVGGRRNDRWCSRLIIDAPHALPHEEGVGIHAGSTGEGAAQQPANDLNIVLNMLGAL